MIDDLQRADKTKGLLGLYPFFSHISDLRLAGEIIQDFPWFSVLHGWWRSNPTYNVAYSTADPNQDFAGRAAMLFKMQPDFPMDADPPSSPSLSANLSSAHTPMAFASNLPGHEDVIGGNDLLPPPPVDVDDGTWNFNDIFPFDDLDMDFTFSDPPTSLAALLPAASSAATSSAATSSAAPIPTISPAALLPAMSSAALPSATSSTTPVSAMSPAVPIPAAFLAAPAPTMSSAAPVPAKSSANPVAPAKPAVISLNDNPGYRPPRRPPLVPSHAESRRMATQGPKFLESKGLSVPTTDDSDSDTAAANLFANLNLKRKTPTPEVSSEETDPKNWFSTDPSPSTTTSKSSHKRARVLASERSDAHDMSTSIITTVRALQEQRSQEHRADRDQKKVARAERLTEKKAQREHELAVMRHRHEHELTMVSHQKSLADSEIRKMQLQLEIMKYQDRVTGQSEAEPEYGEGAL